MIATAVAAGVVWGLFTAIGGGLVPLWSLISYIVIVILFLTFTRVGSL